MIAILIALPFAFLAGMGLFCAMERIESGAPAFASKVENITLAVFVAVWLALCLRGDA